MTSKQRAWLRSKASSIDTIFQIGKGGVSENMLKQIDDALEARELIKCRVLENCEYSPREAAEGIAAATDSSTVTVIGSKFVLFRISPTKRQYDLNNLKMIETDEKSRTSDKKRQQAHTASGTNRQKRNAKGNPGSSFRSSGKSSEKKGNPASINRSRDNNTEYRIIKKNSR